MKVNISKTIFILLVGLQYLIAPQVVFADTKKSSGAWQYRQHTQIKWREYNAAAFAEAKKQGKPVYIFIYSDLCSWCRKFETETLEKASIRKIIKDEFIPVAIDQVAQPELAKQLGISLVPASILLTPTRKKLLRFYGVLSEKDLSYALGKTLASWRKGEIPEEEFGDESTCCPVPGVR